VRVWHKNFPELLNAAAIIKTNLKTGRAAKVLLFRDAKQYGGLEDFMNIKATQINNAAHFSLFMATFSQLLPAKIEGVNRGSMLDLKTIFRARKHTRRIINSLGKNAEGFYIDDRIFQAAEIGRIHAKTA